MDKYVAQRLEQLAYIEKDIQNINVKLNNSDKITPINCNSILKSIVDHIELQQEQIKELKEDNAKLYHIMKEDASGRMTLEIVKEKKIKQQPYDKNAK